MASTSKGGDVGNNDFEPRGAGFRSQQGFIAGIFRIGLGRSIHRAVRSDSIKMRCKEPPCRLPAPLMQHLEKLVIIVQAAAGIGPFGNLVEHDAMQPQARAVLLRHAVDGGEPAQLRQQRGVKSDLGGASNDLARGCRRPRRAATERSAPAARPRCLSLCKNGSSGGLET